MGAGVCGLEMEGAVEGGVGLVVAVLLPEPEAISIVGLGIDRIDAGDGPQRIEPLIGELGGPLRVHAPRREGGEERGDRRGPSDQRRNTTFPPAIVTATRAAASDSAGIVRRSRSITATSASFPGVREPSSPSRKTP